MARDACAKVSWRTHAHVSRLARGTRAPPVARTPHGGVVVAVRCVVASLGFRERDDREHTYA